MKQSDKKKKNLVPYTEPTSRTQEPPSFLPALEQYPALRAMKEYWEFFNQRMIEGHAFTMKMNDWPREKFIDGSSYMYFPTIPRNPDTGFQMNPLADLEPAIIILRELL